MQELLFCGKRIDNGEWIVSGSIRQWENGSVGLMTNYGMFKVEPKTVGQYIGEEDKNNKKVFTNYIICIPPCMSREKTIGIIRFGAYQLPVSDTKEKTHIGFYVDWISKNEIVSDLLRNDVLFWFKEYKNEIEVIGNIHDNPELLEV